MVLILKWEIFILIGLSTLSIISAKSQDIDIIQDAYSSYFGGSGADRLNALQIDKEGFLYIAGFTASDDFPVTQGAYCAVRKGDIDGYVAKININSNKIVWATYIGGSSADYLSNMKIDKNGNVYIIGNTLSSDFPTTINAYDRTYNGASDDYHGDLYISKLTNDGSELIYSTFLGGSGTESFQNIEVDSFGYAYICASTSSVDYPITSGVYDSTFNGYNSGDYLADIVISKLSSDGGSLIFSTFFGGRGNETGIINIDNEHNIVITGQTSSIDFPVTNQTYYTNSDTTLGRNGGNLFLAIVDSTGRNLKFCTFINGNKANNILGTYIDEKDNILIAGNALSTDLPVNEHAYQKNKMNEQDVFIMKYDLENKGINYCTYLGGAESESGVSIIENTRGNIIISGNTLSKDFPTTVNALNKTYDGCRNTQYPWGGDFFICMFDSTLSKLEYSMIINNNCLIIGGSSKSNDFPTTDDALFKKFRGGTDQGGDAVFLKLPVDELLNYIPTGLDATNNF